MPAFGDHPLARCWAATACLALAGACGPVVSDSGSTGSAGGDGAASAESGVSTGGTPRLPPATTTPPMPPPATTQGPQRTTGPITTTGFDPENSGSSSRGFADASTTAAATDGAGCQDEGVYRAIWIPGGLDRVRVYRSDPVASTCTWFTLAWPLDNSPYDIPPANNWATEQILSNHDPESCDASDPSFSGVSEVAEASGTILVDVGGAAAACEVALDISVQLPRGGPLVEMCPDPIALVGC